MTGQQLALIPAEGEVRPPGTPDTVQPYPGHMLRCPQCRSHSFDYMSVTYGACERRTCGYEWKRSAQLHYTEPLPF